MIMHYLKIGLRNIRQQKLLAFINVTGLSVGLACFTIFLLYAIKEFSYDRFNTNADNIYRVYDWWAFTGEKARSGIEPSSATPLGPAMKRDLPEVTEFVRVKDGGNTVRVDGKNQAVHILFADPSLFSVFTFPLISGNPSTVLNDPHNIVITEATAKQLFGADDPVGKNLSLKIDDHFTSFTVSGVAENVPENSSIRFGAVASFDNILQTSYGKASMSDWHMTIGINVYILLKSGAHITPGQLAAFRQRYFPDEKKDLVKDGLWNGKGLYPSGYGLQPLRKVHTGVDVDQWGAVSTRNIWLLIGIAAAILIIACINFTTLAIGRSAGRAKEVGVRKVLGSRRRQLVLQFLAESLLLTLFSAALGVFIAYFLLPYFNGLSGQAITLSFHDYPEMIGLLAGLLIFTGLLSGSYPAFVLSGFKPIEVLRKKIQIKGSNFFIRSLVTFQFILSIGLLIAIIVILQQLSFMHSKNLGFNKDNVVMINMDADDKARAFALLKRSLQSMPQISGITSGSIGLGAQEGQMGRRYDFNGKINTVIEYPVDDNYLYVMGMQLIAGRNFNPALTSDTVNAVIVNEALVKDLLNSIPPQKAIGRRFSAPGSDNPPKTIIGVIRDFNFEDLTRHVRPQMFFCPSDLQPNKMFVRLQPGDPGAILSEIRLAWKKISPVTAFSYSFLDEKFDDFYKEQQRWSRIMSWAGGISALLACLGLFGLAYLAATNRTREIGIRKVLGISAVGVIRLLSAAFLKLVFVAFLIAAPFAWYFMHQWLQAFAYRISINLWFLPQQDWQLLWLHCLQ